MAEKLILSYPDDIGTWAQAEVGKVAQTDLGNGSRSRHTARGSEKSGGGWRVAGGGKVQVDNIHDRRGCGEHLRDSGEVTLKATDGGALGGGGK